MGLFLRKNHLLRYWCWFSLLNWIGSHIISIAKAVSKKIGTLIGSMNFLSPIIWPYMEYCCHVWAGTPSCYLELSSKLQKWLCRTVGPSLVASLEPLAHPQNIASLSLFYRYCFGRCSSELAQLVPLPYSWGRSTPYFVTLHDFSGSWLLLEYIRVFNFSVFEELIDNIFYSNFVFN